MIALTGCFHLTVAEDINLSAILSKDYFNTAFSIVIICSNGKAIKVDTNINTVKLNYACKIDICSKTNVKACIKNLLKILFVVNVNRLDNKHFILVITLSTRSYEVKLLVLRLVVRSAIVMTGRRNGYSFSVKLVATSRTVNYIVIRTCYSTCRFNSVFLNSLACGVSKLSSFCLCNENFVTYRTMLTLSKTGCSTSCSYCLIDYLGVSKLVDSLFGSAELFATYRALNYLIIRTCSLTGSGNYVLLNCCCRGMSKLVDSLFGSAELFATYRALNYFVVRTCSLTGSGNYVLLSRFACGVRKLSSFCLCNENFATYRTMLTLSKTGCSTSCSYCLIDYLGVSKLVDSLFGSAELFATYRALNYLIIRTCSLTGSGNYVLLNCCCRGMSKLVDSLFGSAELFATYRTLNYFVVRALCLTGSRSNILLNCLACSVSCKIENLSRNNLAAIITGNGLGTCNLTSRIYGFCGCVGVSASFETIYNRINHCSITITCSFNSYSLIFGCINTNRCVFTVVTKSSDVVTYTVYGNGNSVCLITCYVNYYVENLIGNGEGNRTSGRRGTKLNTNVALNITRSSINLSGRSKSKVIFTFGICLNRCYSITVCIFFLALRTEVKDQFIGKFSTTVTTNIINIVVSCCGNHLATNDRTTIFTCNGCSTILGTGCFLRNCCYSILMIALCRSRFNINDLYFGKSNLTVSCRACVSCIESGRFSIDCYNSSCLNLTSIKEQVSRISSNISKLNGGNDITFGGRYSNFSVFALIDSPVCTACIIFTCIGTTINCYCNNRIHFKRSVLTFIFPTIGRGVISNVSSNSSAFAIYGNFVFTVSTAITHNIVSGCRNSFLCSYSIAAISALNTRGDTRFGTCSIFCSTDSGGICMLANNHTRTLQHSKRHCFDSYLIRTINIKLKVIVRFISKIKRTIFIGRGY